jgi:hypothetical protein
MQELAPGNYKAKGEQVFRFEVLAWDINCPKHIPRRYEEEEVARLLETRDDPIESLREEIARLRSGAP